MKSRINNPAPVDPETENSNDNTDVRNANNNTNSIVYEKGANELDNIKMLSNKGRINHEDISIHSNEKNDKQEKTKTNKVEVRVAAGMPGIESKEEKEEEEKENKKKEEDRYKGEAGTPRAKPDKNQEEKVEEEGQGNGEAGIARAELNDEQQKEELSESEIAKGQGENVLTPKDLHLVTGEKRYGFRYCFTTINDLQIEIGTSSLRTVLLLEVLKWKRVRPAEQTRFFSRGAQATTAINYDRMLTCRDPNAAAGSNITSLLISSQQNPNLFRDCPHLRDTNTFSKFIVILELMLESHLELTQFLYLFIYCAIIRSWKIVHG